jgi:hypothetical protein
MQYKCPKCGRIALQSKDGCAQPIIVCCGKMIPIADCEAYAEGAKNTEQSNRPDNRKG